MKEYIKPELLLIEETCEDIILMSVVDEGHNIFDAVDHL